MNNKTEPSTELVKSENMSGTKHSIPILISYNGGEFLGQILGRTIGGIYLFFYETELMLAAFYIIAAQVIYAIWNAVNDPILGYLCAKPRKWTSKWGKYYPWILISGIPMILSYVLVLFTPIHIPSWAIFLWMVVSLCLADTFASLFGINHIGLYPSKFYSETDRRRSGQVNVIIGTFGTVIAAILPAMIYEFNNIPSYRTMALVFGGMSVIVWILLLPSVKPSQVSLQHEIAETIKEKELNESFITVFKSAFKQKNFIIYLVAGFCYSLWVSMATTSLPYMIKYIYKLEASYQTYIWAFYLVGTLISLPIWNKLAKKYGFAKLYGYGLLFMGCCTVPLIFVRHLYLIFVVFFAMGVALGGFWVVYFPIFGEVMDEIFYNTKKNQTGVYLGIRTFITRFEIILRTVLFVGIHELTGFNAEVIDQTPQGSFGIVLHAAILPAIIAIFGALFFIKKYDVSTEKRDEIQQFLSKSRNLE